MNDMVGRLKGASEWDELVYRFYAYESMYALFTSTAYQLVDNKYSSGNEFNAEYIHTQHNHTHLYI